MPDRYRIAVAARLDLDAIWFHTAETWSPDQADRYEEELHQAFERLVRNPGLGEGLPNRSDDARRLIIGRHCIAYRVDTTLISVLRVLHQNSDWQSLLSG